MVPLKDLLEIIGDMARITHLTRASERQHRNHRVNACNEHAFVPGQAGQLVVARPQMLPVCSTEHLLVFLLVGTPTAAIIFHIAHPPVHLLHDFADSC